MKAHADLLRTLPSVERLRQLVGDVVHLGEPVGEKVVIEAIRSVVEELRSRLKAGVGEVELEEGRLAPGPLAQAARERAIQWMTPSLRRVINGTGVVIHTNLGRAPLGAGALEHMAEVAAGYCNLEYDLAAGERGSRFVHAERLMALLTGAPACLVVNNNAAAVLLVLTALGRGREVVVSRSELIEIGGSFRLPDIMAVGGAQLREVGTTNKTHLSDYERAIGPNTGLVMRAHRSNFAVEGFVEDVERKELVALCKAKGLYCYEDLGSGLMHSSTAFEGAEQEVARCVADGLDLVSFSGDKLLGGPQAGVILGDQPLIRKLQKHPMTRALRPDKLTLAALESVSLSYLSGKWREQVPVWRMLEAEPEELHERAAALCALVGGIPGVQATLVPMTSRVGGGALPTTQLPSWGVKVEVAGYSEESLSQRLRSAQPPVLGRLEGGAFGLDVRTVQASELSLIAELVRSLAGSKRVD